MLCNVCFLMLRGQEGRVWKGTYDLHFNHHKSKEDLLRSEKMHCGICRVLYEELLSQPEQSHDPDMPPLSITASLSVLHHPRVQNLFRLDFKLRYGKARHQRTFVLKQNNASDPPFRTPISRSTESDEVYQLATQWMSRCKCVHPDKPQNWYPARLLSFEQLKDQNFLDTRRLISTGQLTNDSLYQVKVKLVETADWKGGRPDHGDIRYVTLSHCWGTRNQNQLKLNSRNLAEFKEGIKLSDLPQTFRDAVLFASRLYKVGYIWIDSLCIKQGPEELEDWITQSATMDRVYSESFLNISATAAEGSDQGLFSERNPESLLEDEVLLNIEGIPGVINSRSSTMVEHNPDPEKASPPRATASAHWLGYWLLSAILVLLCRLQALISTQLGRKLSKPPTLLMGQPNSNESKAMEAKHNRHDSVNSTGEASKANSETDRKSLRRCTILDVALWKNHVDDAPVNRRGWVLQERLMAPRVLHFCKRQIAWECAEFDAAEGQPQGMPIFHLDAHGLVEERRLKGLIPEIDGKRLRQMRLAGYGDPDAHLRPKLYAFELWRRIVEVYSRTAITNPGDKLVALSGIARWMAQRIGSDAQPAEYVAGMWKEYLASQLLWRVDPVFRPADSSFEHLSTAPEEYRAPSFSWASLDTHQGNGIVYGEVTDRDLFIEVEDVKIKMTAKFEGNEYGMIHSGHVKVRGKLRKARLSREEKGRFCWQFVDREELDEEKHTNVYLDCPSRDADSIFGPEAGVFVLPAAKGERTASAESKYLICLLLQLVKDGKADDGPAFRRIGLTKLSPWADHKALHNDKVLEVFNSDVDMPHRGYDQETGMHRILII